MKKLISIVLVLNLTFQSFILYADETRKDRMPAELIKRMENPSIATTAADLEARLEYDKEEQQIYENTFKWVSD